MPGMSENGLFLSSGAPVVHIQHDDNITGMQYWEIKKYLRRTKGV